MTPDPTYADVGGTRPADADWNPPGGYRAFEGTISLHSSTDWAELCTDLLRWGVKTRSGFRVSAAAEHGRLVENGRDFRLTARLGPITITEPVRVVAVVDEPDRCGFAYGTLPGHPVSGEEAFVVHRDATGTTHLTLRSLTRAAPGGAWRAAFPALLLAQRAYRFRYLRAYRRTAEATAAR